jgi:hypothetical protein
MALHPVPTPTRTFDSRHTADDCAICAALYAGTTAMVLAAGSCDGLRDKDLVASCGLTRGVFSRHAGDVQRCLVTAYVRVADTVLRRFESAVESDSSWEAALRDGIVAAVRELDDDPGAAFLYFVAADRSRDPVMWLERAAARERFVQAVVGAPFAEAFGEVHAEMFVGAVQSAVRRRILADEGAIDDALLVDDIDDLVDVFHPSR